MTSLGERTGTPFRWLVGLICFACIPTCYTAAQQRSILTYPKHTDELPQVFVYTSFSRSGIAYMGFENRFLVSTPNFGSRYITLTTRDTVAGELTCSWEAVFSSGQSVFRYRAANPEMSGAYHPDKYWNSEKYLDTNDIEWRKYYVLNPKAGKTYEFVLYEELSDSVHLLHDTLLIHSYPVPDPWFMISYTQFLASDILEAKYHEDLKKGEEWFRITEYVFEAFDKKGRSLFRQRCFGRIVTPEMKQAMQHPKCTYVVLSEMKSEQFDLPDYRMDRP